MNRIAGQVKRPLGWATLSLLLFALGACTSIYRNHGYAPTEEELAALTVGVDTRDSVIETVGSPGSSGVLEDSGYYYIASRVRYYGAREPEVVSRELVAISFDPSGRLRNIERYGLEDGRVIPLQRRVTESSVEDRTFLRQLLGNLGRFDPGTVLPSSEQ